MTRESRFLSAAQAVANARVAESTAFLRYKVGKLTDGQAKARAIVETQSALDVALAELELARRALDSE